MPEVEAIERNLADPWSDEKILALLRARNVIGMVVEDEADRVIGYMIYSLHRKRIHLERIAVYLADRKKGAFRAMIDKLRGKLDAHRRTSVSAVVDERNLPLLLAMKACGFLAFDLIPGHFEDADGIAMNLTLDS